MAEPTPRRYRSPRRAMQAAQTRGAVLTAARALLAERGWAATGMRDVARSAGVSVETIYATFGSKVALLTAALDGAVVGDDEPVPLGERPVFRAMRRGTPQERAGAAADLITDRRGRGRREPRRAVGPGVAGRPATTRGRRRAPHPAPGCVTGRPGRQPNRRDSRANVPGASPCTRAATTSQPGTNTSGRPRRTPSTSASATRSGGTGRGMRRS